MVKLGYQEGPGTDPIRSQNIYYSGPLVRLHKTIFYMIVYLIKPVVTNNGPPKY